jgi:plastocyanin
VIAGLVGALSALAAVASLTASAAAQDDLPPQEPGVTQRIYQIGHTLDSVCTIKPGQTPNVDVLRPTIDWQGNSDFGGHTDNFITHAIANLWIEDAGTYTFRLRSDDGSKLYIDDELVIDHDGLHGAEDKDGDVQLDEGVHKLRVEHFEAGGEQELRLSWRPPGAGSFSIVPNSALSTDAGIVRVTAPGNKECVGGNTPGDGLPLDDVNPAYDLVNLRPAGFEPKVTGLDWMGDDLLVLTWGDEDGSPDTTTEAGEVWRLSGVKEADDPSDVQPTLIAEGLKEPMGIKVVDGEIYTPEKHRLTKLVDANDDGFYEGKETIATWPFGGNFHEFAFGLLYKDGWFYLNLSVSINLGGATTVPQPADDRGTHIRVNKETGEIEYIAGGFRTPHGIGWGPEGEIFVTDNQGGWLPANKLIHVQPGRFYNHYTTGPSGPGRFDDQVPTPPSLWLPHNEIANSPSQPLLIEDGPFAGQMLVGDVTYGGLQRAFLEKVEGEYQGAYFRMTQGLEAGITRMLWSDDGSLIVGGLGAGGNWGQPGKLTYGLQKLVPNGTLPFEIQKMELAEGGFDLTYTKPLSEETIEGLADKYVVRQWYYVPTPAYGGPKIGEEELAVTDVTVSQDRKTVSLKIDGLKPGRVVYVRSPRPFESEDGEELYSTEAWYTLNNLPGYEAPESHGLYELEEGTLTGGAQFDTEHAGYSGAGFVSGFGTPGASVKIQAEVPRAGNYKMTLRYANGPHPFSGDKKISLIVNGDRRQITLPPTQAWTNYQLYVDEVTLEEGTNTIELKYDEGDDGHVNLDSLRLAPAGTVRYEAEDAELSGGAVVQDEHAGFSGTGYVGGYWNEGATTTFSVIALADAETEIAIGYANGPNPFTGTKRVSLYVNGQFAKKVAFPDTGGWASYSEVHETVNLRAGANEITLRYEPGDEGNINIDYLDVTQNEPPSCDSDVDPNDEFDGDQLDRCRWPVIVRPNPSQLSVGDGKLSIETGNNTDMFGANTTAENIVLQPAPDGAWEITTKLHMPFSGKQWEQAGMFVYGSDSDWAKLTFMNSPDDGRVFEFTLQDNGTALFDSSLDLAPVPASYSNEVYLKIRNDGTWLTAFYSDNGEDWHEFGRARPLSAIPNPMVGVSAYNGNGSGNAAEFDFFHVEEIDAGPTCTEAEEPDPGFEMLFDGTEESFSEWKMAGPGGFNLTPDCTLESFGGLGLLYYPETFDSPVTFRLEWMMPGDDNSGVFVGNWGPDPNYSPDPAWDAVDHGYEIQIDATDDDDSTTGAIYNFQAPDIALRDQVLNPPGQWNQFEITVDDPKILVRLNGVLINEFTSTDPARDLSRTKIGLQNHGAGDEVYFRRVQVREEPEDTTPPETTATLDPAQPGPGGTYHEPVTVNFLASDPAEDGGAEPQTHEVGASEFSWDPAELTINQGDSVHWDWSSGSHDLCLGQAELPGAVNPVACEAGFERLGSNVLGQSDPFFATEATRQFDQPGTWTFYCSIHYPAMSGTIEVQPAEGGGYTQPSGVAYTEYRVNGGEWVQLENTGGDEPFASSATFEQPGDYDVEFRSADNAGNVEDIEAVSFEIAEPPVGQVPVNLEPPTIEGSGKAGTMLTCKPGTWSLPGAYTFTWLRDSGSGFEVVDNRSTNPKRYRTAAEDVGSQVACRVTRTNSNGTSAPAQSAPVAITPRGGPADVPENTVEPTLTDSAGLVVDQIRAGRKLKCERGEWTGTGSYAYIWLRDGEEFANPSTNPATYNTTVADIGSEITCVVTRTSKGGTSEPAYSNDVLVTP